MDYTWGDIQRWETGAADWNEESDQVTAPYAVLVRPDGTYKRWDHEPDLGELTEELHYLEQCPGSLLAFPNMGILWDEQPDTDEINGMAENLTKNVKVAGPIIVHGPAGEDGEMLALPPAIGNYVVAMCELFAYINAE